MTRRRQPHHPTTTRLPVDHGQLAVHTRALVSSGGPHQLVELRWRRPSGMGQRFYRPRELATMYRTVGWLAGETDVYLGVAPRRRRAGTRAAIAATRLLWVDCDSDQASQSLEDFSPAPSIVVASGGHGHRHAYWLLSDPLDADELERANRTLASALGADQACADAARVLRPAGTNNFKHHPPRPVVLERMDRRRRPVTEILAGLRPASPIATTRDRGGRATGGDPLLAIAPPDYVRALLGVEPGRDGKIACPFHGPERTPSLHVYPSPQRGWYCYGCGAGGSVLDLAARLWGLELRGGAVLDIRVRLDSLLNVDSHTWLRQQRRRQATPRRRTHPA